jgi:hypothetical protein
MINTYVKPIGGQPDYAVPVSNNISKVVNNLGYMNKIKYIGSKAIEAIENVVSDLDRGELYGSTQGMGVVTPDHMNTLFGLFMETKNQVEDKDRMSNLAVVLNALQKILSNPAGQQLLGTAMQQQIISDAEMNLMMQMASDEQSPLTAMGLYFAMYADMATALLRTTSQKNKIQNEAPEMVREILNTIAEKNDKETIEHNILVSMYNHGLIPRDAIEQMKVNRNTVFMPIGNNNQTLNQNAGFVGVSNNNNANNVVTSHTMIMNPYGQGTGAYVTVNGGSSNIPVPMDAPNVNVGQPLPNNYMVPAYNNVVANNYNSNMNNSTIPTPVTSNISNNFINQAATMMNTNTNNFMNNQNQNMFNPNAVMGNNQNTFDMNYMHGVLQSRGFQPTNDLGVPAYVDQMGYYYLVSAPQFRNNVRPYFIGSFVGNFPIKNENELQGGGLALTIVNQAGQEAHVFLLPELLNQYNLTGNATQFMTPSNNNNVFGTFANNNGFNGNFTTNYSFNNNNGYGNVGFNQNTNNNNQVNPFVAAYRAINGPQQKKNEIVIPRFMG